MYHIRIRIFLLIAFVLGGVLVVRLVDLQMRHACHYREVISDRRKSPFKPVPAKRGRILASGAGGRNLVELVGNLPTFELVVYYPVMDPDKWWLRRELRRPSPATTRCVDSPARPVEQTRPAETPEQRLERRIDAFWRRLAHLTAPTPGEVQARFDLIRKRRERIVRTVRRCVSAIERKQRELGNLPDDGELDYPVDVQRMSYPVVYDIEHDLAVKLRLALGNDPWASLRPSYSRIFRPGETLCHILGRTSRQPGLPQKVYPDQLDDLPGADLDDDAADSENAARSDRDDAEADALPMPGQLYGRTGLEGLYDDTLRGRCGWVELTDPPHVAVEPVDGRDLVLTIDYALQRFARQALDDRVAGKLTDAEGEPLDRLDYATGGAVVVLNLPDNAVLAMVSTPTYDPADLRSVDTFRKLATDHKHLPLLNKAALGRYPPGSIVKPFVAQFALDIGATHPTRTIQCTGRYSEDNPAFRCWLYTGGHGHLNLEQAIAQSCDVYFYHIGEEICGLVGRIANPDPERLSEYYRAYGLGAEPPGLAIPLAEGFVPTQRWFLEHRKRGISRGDARNLAIGQGDLLVTPIQAANMLSTLLTGRLRPLRLVRNDTDLPPAIPLSISRAHIDLIRRGMQRVVNDPEHGGAYHTVHSDRVRLAGKTGSAEAPMRPVRWKLTWRDGTGATRVEVTTTPWVRKRDIRRADPHAEAFRQTAVAWHPVLSEEDRKRRTDRPNKPAHAWFIGYAPADDPKIVAAVLVEYGMAGARAAGPVFREVALKCHELGYLD